MFSLPLALYRDEELLTDNRHRINIYWESWIFGSPVYVRLLCSQISAVQFVSSRLVVAFTLETLNFYPLYVLQWDVSAINFYKILLTVT